MKIGLVLSGGGARGAYQVGALHALSALLGARRPLPFAVLVGTSAGAITSCFLGTRAHDFSLATHRLVDFWSQLRPHDVFRTDAKTLSRVALQWAMDLSLGGLVGRHRQKSLLVSEPLRALLEDRLDMTAVHDNIRRGLLHGLALTATDYRTSLGVTFFDGATEIPPWTRSTRFGIREHLTIAHVMASSAIPIFFPAVRVGDAYYADGCLRSVAPLSPAIHLGSDRILAIGVRSAGAPDRPRAAKPPRSTYPSIADTAGLVLNAVFVESLEADVERLERINQALGFAVNTRGMALRRIPLFVLRPSEDLGLLARDTLTSLPLLVQHLFRGLGISGRSGLDLLSYLAFDRTYTSKLIALGHRDVMANASRLLDFITGEGATTHGAARA